MFLMEVTLSTWIGLRVNLVRETKKSRMKKNGKTYLDTNNSLSSVFTSAKCTVRIVKKRIRFSKGYEVRGKKDMLITAVFCRVQRGSCVNKKIEKFTKL